MRRYLLGVFTIIIIVCSNHQANAFFFNNPPDLNQGCKDIGEKLNSRLTSDAFNGKKIAVRKLTASDGSVTLLGHRLADLLTNALLDNPERKYHIVERLQIAELMTEWSAFESQPNAGKVNILGEDGSYGSEAAVWAKRLEADFAVVGSYYIKKEILSVSCRVISAKTSQSVVSAEADIQMDENIMRLHGNPEPDSAFFQSMEALGTTSEELTKKISRVSLYGVSGKTKKPFGPGKTARFFPGQKMGFTVCPPMDSNLYIMNYDPNGHDQSVVFLYPLPQIPSKPFLKDRTYTFPNCIDPEAVAFDVDPPLGRMVFKVIGVDPHSAINLIQDVNAEPGYYQLKKDKLKMFLQKLSVLPKASWWEESVEYWVSVKPRQENAINN